MKHKYTCKCCWFKSLVQSFWDCDLYNICKWVDTFDWNLYPLSIWINKKSLYEYQLDILKKIPNNIKEYDWYIRDKNWKPINIKEIKNKDKPYIEKWFYNEIKKDWDYLLKNFEEAQKYNPTKY